MSARPGQAVGGPDGGEDQPADVPALRREIETLDRQLLETVARRVQLARQIGHAKQQAGSPTLNPSREAAVIRSAVESGRELALPEEPVRQLFWTLVGLCRTAQLEEQS